MPDGASQGGSVHNDQFEPAISMLFASMRGNGRTLHYGAHRSTGEIHAGIDLPVPFDTPVALPVEEAVLISKSQNGQARGSMGNSLVFFVPHDEQPYFLFLHRLSDRTWKEMDDRKIKIGDSVLKEDGRPIAYTGNTGRGATPHLHLSAAKKLGAGYTAEEFLQMHKGGTLSSFLEGKDLQSAPAPTNGDLGSCGYLDPISLIETGKLGYPKTAIASAVAMQNSTRSSSVQMENQVSASLAGVVIRKNSGGGTALDNLVPMRAGGQNILQASTQPMPSTSLQSETLTADSNSNAVKKPPKLATV